MDNSSFHRFADDALEHLASTIEESDKQGVLDIDFVNDVLTIILKDDSEYVINKHSASEQIWMSSPFSGAARFSMIENKPHRWVDRKDNDLFNLLESELTHHANIKLKL